jgi:hypothetical protein
MNPYGALSGRCGQESVKYSYFRKETWYETAWVSVIEWCGRITHLVTSKKNRGLPPERVVSQYLLESLIRPLQLSLGDMMSLSPFRLEAVEQHTDLNKHGMPCASARLHSPKIRT